MDSYNISEYISIVRKGLTSCSGQGPAGVMILEQIGNFIEPRVFFDDTKISRLVKHMNNVPAEIINAVADPKFINLVISGFKSNVAKDFNHTTIDNVSLSLIRSINNDHTLAETYKEHLNAIYLSHDNSTFLAHALVHAVGRENTNQSKQTPVSDIPLLSETSNHCPLCGKSLIKNSKGREISNYEITKIFDDLFDEDTKKILEKVYPAPLMPDSFDNKIALCLSCFGEYRADPTIENYESLWTKKRQFKNNVEISNELADVNIEKELSDIINDIGSFTENKIGGLIPMDPKEMVEKIPDDVLLKDDITRWVLKYYKYIENQFSNLEAKGITRFSIVAKQVSLAFDRLDARGNMTKREIFYQLSKWMCDSLSRPISEISVVNILIAFFVQNCEVFYAIS